MFNSNRKTIYLLAAFAVVWASFYVLASSARDSNRPDYETCFRQKGEPTPECKATFMKNVGAGAR